MTAFTRRTRLAIGLLGLLIGLAPIVVAATGTGDDPVRVAAGCDETIDTTDSFSMNCAPTMIPDMSDQLTEAEVAEPGWNAHPGGGGR
mgnify:CR=1 FL=1